MELARELFDRAEQQEQDGNSTEAIESWRKLSTIHPSAPVFCRLGRLARSLGYTTEARLSYERAIEADPSFAIAYVSLALMAIEANENDEAQALLEISLRHEESAVSYGLRGVALMNMARDQEAAACFERALAMDPTYDEAYFNFGVLLRERDAGRAERLFRKALEYCPDYQEAHRELGWLLSKALHGPDAEHHLRRAVELKADDGWAHVYLGNHLWRNADADSALVEFKRAVAVAPDQAFTLSFLANFYEDRLEWDEARHLYIRALELDPDDPVVNMGFGRMLKKKGENELAKRYLLRAVSLDPEYEAAKQLLVELTQ